MSRFFRWALGASVALLLAAALAVGCSDDEQSQQQAQQQTEEQQQQQAAAEQQAQPQQQQERQAAAPSSAAQQQEQQQQQTEAEAVSAEPLNVVVSTQVIADWVRQVGGDRVNVRALVPAGADAHVLELTVSDIRAIAEADLVVINGAGLESFYLDAIEENADNILDLAEAIEAAGSELMPFGGLGDEMHEDDHGAVEAVGRLLVADAVEAHLSVVNLESDTINRGLFEIAAPGARVLPSPTHRFGFVLALGPEDDDDRVQIFDGGIFLVEHGDHFDLVQGRVSQLPLEIVEENPIHFVNSHGWTAIFADTSGHALLINEHDLATTEGNYEPIVLEAGPQHGAALVVSDEHVVVTTKDPDDPDAALPVGVEVRTFDDEVVYDASNGSCPGMHGEAHNEDGAAFGCIGGVLFLHTHDGEYEHEFVDNPSEMREESRIAVVFGHHHLEHFFGAAYYFDGQEFVFDGIWLIDVAHGEMELVFDEPTSTTPQFSSDGETLYVLNDEGILHALDAHDGDLIEAVDLVEPGEAGQPAFIVVGEWLYVADPNSGHVLGVHLEHMEIEEEWEVGGAPSSLAFVGVLDSGGAPGQGHDDHGDEEDDHGDEHEEDEHEEDEHEEDEHEDEGDGHGHHHHHHGSEDPHFWFDADLASVAIEAIAHELSHLNPDDADVFSDRLELYLAEIDAADAEARALLEAVPDHHRLLVTFHDAFAYFARRYGLEIVGFLIEGPEQGISAESIAELIELIEHEGVETVFHEPQFDSSALDAVASETGANRGIIWSQPTVDNPTYLGILLGNVRAIVEQ